MKKKPTVVFPFLCFHSFGARTAKAIHEVVCGIKNAYEVDGKDTNGMKTANEQFGEE